MELQDRRRADEEAAPLNFAQIVARAPWIETDLLDLGDKIGALNASKRVKLRRLIELADRIAAAVQPNSACRGRGCTACCYQAVPITQVEAEVIEQDTGHRATYRFSTPELDRGASGEYAVKHFRQPCTFLREGNCSIYAHRPIACRLSFNIGASPFFCDPAIAPADSLVPNIDLRRYWVAHAFVLQGQRMGDLRDFFPRPGPGDCAF